MRIPAHLPHDGLWGRGLGRCCWWRWCCWCAVLGFAASEGEGAAVLKQRRQHYSHFPRWWRRREGASTSRAEVRHCLLSDVRGQVSQVVRVGQLPGLSPISLHAVVWGGHDDLGACRGAHPLPSHDAAKNVFNAHPTNRGAISPSQAKSSTTTPPAAAGANALTH
jgi:hypothetical protein